MTHKKNKSNEIFETILVMQPIFKFTNALIRNIRLEKSNILEMFK